MILITIEIIIFAVLVVVFIVEAVALWRNTRGDKAPVAVIERNGVLVLSMFRSEINQYAKEIHQHRNDDDTDPDLADAQQVTCQEILKELDRAIREAYEIDTNMDVVNYWDGMTVEEMMFALSNNALSDKVKILSTGLVRAVASDEENVLLLGTDAKVRGAK